MSYGSPILIDTTWYLPFWDSPYIDLLYKEGNCIKVSPRGIFLKKYFTTETDTVTTFMDWSLEKYGAINNNGLKVLVNKKVTVDNDTIYRFATFYQDEYMRTINTEGKRTLHYIGNKEDWDRVIRDTASVEIYTTEKFGQHSYCYLEISKKRGLLHTYDCKNTKPYTKCTYDLDISNYEIFMKNSFPKVSIKRRDFFSEMPFGVKYTTPSIGNKIKQISYLSIDTNSIVINKKHFYILSLNIMPSKKPRIIPNPTGATITFIMQVPYGLVSMNKGKFWVTGKLDRQIKFDELDHKKELVFDLNSRFRKKWTVNNHPLFGGEITLKSKKKKVSLFEIQPNKKNNYPNLVSFEVHKELGFISFSFKNENNEIIKQNVVRN